MNEHTLRGYESDDTLFGQAALMLERQQYALFAYTFRNLSLVRLCDRGMFVKERNGMSSHTHTQ